MSIPRSTIVAAGLGVLAVAATASFSHDGPDGHEHGKPIAPAVNPADYNPEQMMAAWLEAGQPTERHKMLDHFVGEWDLTFTIWEGGAGSAPMVTTGQASTKWIMDGRFLKEDVTATMMGMPFTGMGITGYDNFGGCYRGIWMDSLSTSFGVTTGHSSMDGSSIEFYGKMDEPMMGMRSKTYRQVIRCVDDNNHVFEKHDPHIGEPNTLVMRIEYKRRGT